MDCLRLCRAQTVESGFAPGPSEGADGLYHGVQPPSAHHAENSEVRRTPRCLVLRGVFPARGGWGRDGADVGPGLGRRWCSSSTMRILRMGKNGSHGAGIFPSRGLGHSREGALVFLPAGQMPLFWHLAAVTLHLQNAQCESGALHVERLTGDYREARIMVILFAEPRRKIRPGWRIYFSSIKRTGGSSKVH